MLKTLTPKQNLALIIMQLEAGRDQVPYISRTPYIKMAQKHFALLLESKHGLNQRIVALEASLCEALLISEKIDVTAWQSAKCADKDLESTLNDHAADLTDKLIEAAGDALETAEELLATQTKTAKAA